MKKNQNEQTETALREGQPVKVEPLEPKAGRKSFSTRLDGEAGATLRVFTVVRKDGAVTYAIHTTGPKGARKSVRGATSQHPTVEAARTAADRIVAEAEKRGGWRKAQRGGGGFAVKPDAFSLDSLPKAKAK
jgi:hypothetical protein